LLNSFAWINHSFSKFEERHGDGDAAYEEVDPVYGGYRSHPAGVEENLLAQPGLVL
jgi:hypothetical protein